MDENKVWFVIAVQALKELDRPLKLDEAFAKEVMSGKWEVLSAKAAEDGANLFIVRPKEQTFGETV